MQEYLLAIIRYSIVVGMNYKDLSAVIPTINSAWGETIKMFIFIFMVFRFLFIVCAFPVWGGQEYPVPPSVCLLERM